MAAEACPSIRESARTLASARPVRRWRERDSLEEEVNRADRQCDFLARPELGEPEQQDQDPLVGGGLVGLEVGDGALHVRDSRLDGAGPDVRDRCAVPPRFDVYAPRGLDGPVR